MLSVRVGDGRTFRTLADLAGKNVATLGGTIAYEILLRAERQTACTLYRTRTTCTRTRISYLGRVDAVLLDNVLAERRQRRMSGFDSATDGRGRVTTSASWRQATLRSEIAINDVLRGAMRDGTSSASSASGTSGTTISRRCTPGCWPASRPAGHTRRRGH